MKLNVRKADIMILRNESSTASLHYEGIMVKLVESAGYLGSTLHTVGTCPSWKANSGLEA